MWATIFSGLFVLSALAFFLVQRRQRAEIAALKIALGKIELEETRVFDFLHGLGEAFSADTRRNDLPRLIVEGAITILNAAGGALYASNVKRSALVISYLSKNSPPLIDASPLARQTASPSRSGTSALEAYQRLHAIEPGEGVSAVAGRAIAVCVHHGCAPGVDF